MKLNRNYSAAKTSSRTLSFIAFLSCQHFAAACGGFFCQPQQPVLQAGESIAFGIRQNGNVVDIDMAVQINYEGPAEGFAWILPVPAQPDISTGSDLLFSGLFEATRPTFSFTIDDSMSTTCTEEQLQVLCANFDGAPEADSPGAVADDAESEAVVLEQGSVGPFEFVTLEAAEGRPESVFEWLNDNGYDQPEEAEGLITFYAEMGMKFVALRLLKDSDTGLIRPVVLQYSMEGNLADTALACVPIQLTSIAATPDMPIQVYLLAPSRGIAYNYVDLGIDMGLIDWVGCQFFGGGQNCFLNSLRSLVDAAALTVDGHAFVTEFAGSTTGLEGSIAVDIVLDNLKMTSNPLDFLNLLQAAGIPDIPLVHTVIEGHIPNQYQVNDRVPPFCAGLVNVYTPDTPWMMNGCVDFVDFGGTPFDPEALANELDTEIFQPAQDAEMWVLSYTYLTRLYGQLDPEQMTKDPLFGVNDGLPDVSNNISAVGVPVCDGSGPVALDIYVGESQVPTTVEATRFCGVWQTTSGGFVFDGSMSPALSMTGYGLSGESTSTLFRDPATGQFAAEEVEGLVAVLDDRVPGQSGSGSVDPPEADGDGTDGTDGDGDGEMDGESGSPFVGVFGSLLVVFAMALIDVVN